MSCFAWISRSSQRERTISLFKSLNELFIDLLDCVNPSQPPPFPQHSLPSPVAQAGLTEKASSEFNRVTPLLHTLHWLPIERGIDFKLASLCFKSLNDSAPTYLSDLFSPLHSFSTAPFFYRHHSVQKTILSHTHTLTHSALSLTKLQQHGTNSPLLSVTHPLQFLQIFLENLSISENFFFSPPALRCLYVSRCVFVCGCVGVCLCVCVQARVHVFSVCVFKLLTSKYMHVLNL